MKTKLISPSKNQPYFKLFNSKPLINIEDFKLTTKLGKKVPGFLKPLFFKQFVFAGIITKTHIAGAAIADLGYASKGFVYLHNLETNSFTEKSSLIFPFFKKTINPRTENTKAYFKAKDLEIKLSPTNLLVDSKNLKMDLEFLKEKPPPPLRICSKTSYNRWFFTKKQTPIKSRGKIFEKNNKIEVFSETSRSITDRSLGYPGREVWWNWASTAFLLDFKEFGMNLSWGINQTGETENFVFYDEKFIKINQVNFEKEDNDTWSIKSNDKIIDLKFYPKKTKTEKVNFIFTASNFIQYLGIFKGKIKLEDSKFKDVEFWGWLEDHYIKW
ncbi:MAG: DUF2804 domain-containing protein [Desulforegulaceae bacterium]|nr:DUF2804 domain-containing protein [Desulforegulaceae bacterium]